ncbi:MAG: carbon-nitrogen hydrolase family protein [bacterium]
MSRYVTVAGVSDSPSQGEFEDDLSGFMDRTSEFIERAAWMGADIVSFPEIYPQMRFRDGEARVRAAETVPGPTAERIAGEARRWNIHIVWPLFQRDGDRVYNSSVLFGPDGDVIGIYHKMHPTIGEIESGVTPGDSPSVFETEFGRVGLVICFDLNFPDTMRGLGERGAEVIFFSSMYRGGLQLRAWAFELGAYIVSAITGELGQIVDMGGRILAEATSPYNKVIARRVNLDRRILHLDYNEKKIDAILEKYGPSVSLEFYTREAQFTIASERDDLSVDDIIREFELEERSNYFRRANEVRARALKIFQ